MSRRANPFDPRIVLVLLLVGALAFLLFLYALGQGWTGGSERDGGGHASGNGLNGYSGLVTLLEATGHDVSLSRNQGSLEDYGLQVLTPPLWTDGEELDAIIEQRIADGNGPTLLILPKWFAMPVPPAPGIESKKGWVVLANASSPEWFGNLAIAEGTRLAIGRTGGWQGLGASGALPVSDTVQALVGDSLNTMRPLLVDSEGDVLAAEVLPPIDEDGFEPWPVVVVFEPDLLNNHGLADRERAAMAVTLVERAMEGEDLPIRFDLTLNGLGSAANLLTLAFRPPFLAATLCLLLAALVIGWRAFRRFGPAVAEEPAMAQGKRQLARNGAALVERVKRWHLLKAPYEDMVGRRIAAALGLRHAETGSREEAIDRALARRGHDGPPFSRLASNLRAADKPRDIIRAAQGLRDLERTVKE
ncbi:DUF4350 domain-containing protein [Aurantiacibacter poecillastricola]|uniref:DUF4350 domain-containing protein n=1 Tax=Aurantiacibacter poecillastricola TaxID=3064385 RepID=UPI00273E3258|nr:DUF4350 domain-containing protein [Aurantiacibacter sp. 219JJ12-13]MDP5261092.1 DUF4350 domain-containing protein [Aurantiacibacter sp. 219JJ12-13]